tara:strand:- start:3 stop:515 length:513 start_codon:yes stop_codon:yes gene_type:complete
MLKEWNLEPRTSFNISHKKISWLIDLVSNIRSTKVNLNVSPGSFVDVSTSELSSNKAKIIENNLNVLKRLGRVSNVSNSKLNNNAIKIIVKGETVILYFDQNIDLKEQKQKIDLKIKDLNQKLSKIGNKLKNKSFMKNAPKQIVENEKKALIEHKIELKKLNSIINSIRN